MFEVGQRVQVTDQVPPAVGIVEEVSTWLLVLGEPAKAEPCYRICWQDSSRCISGTFVKEIDVK